MAIEIEQNLGGIGAYKMLKDRAKSLMREKARDGAVFNWVFETDGNISEQVEKDIKPDYGKDFGVKFWDGITQKYRLDLAKEAYSTIEQTLDNPNLKPEKIADLLIAHALTGKYIEQLTE